MIFEKETRPSDKAICGVYRVTLKSKVVSDFLICWIHLEYNNIKVLKGVL